MRRLALALGALCLLPILARAESCKSERGEAATSLAEQCTDVSPATHPPCNPENSCDMIESEIARGCGLLDAKARPKFCRDFEAWDRETLLDHVLDAGGQRVGNPRFWHLDGLASRRCLS